MKINTHNLLIFTLLFLIEVMIALFVHDRFIRPFFGDMLVVLLIFYFVRIFYIKKVFLVILGVLVFAYSVEILQYFNIIELLGVENRILQIAIGSVFDWKDMIAYSVGAVVLFVITILTGKQNLK